MKKLETIEKALPFEGQAALCSGLVKWIDLLMAGMELPAPLSPAEGGDAGSILFDSAGFDR